MYALRLMSIKKKIEFLDSNYSDEVADFLLQNKKANKIKIHQIIAFRSSNLKFIIKKCLFKDYCYSYILNNKNIDFKTKIKFITYLIYNNHELTFEYTYNIFKWIADNKVNGYDDSFLLYFQNNYLTTGNLLKFSHLVPYFFNFKLLEIIEDHKHHKMMLDIVIEKAIYEKRCDLIKLIFEKSKYKELIANHFQLIRMYNVKDFEDFLYYLYEDTNLLNYYNRTFLSNYFNQIFN